MKIKLLAWSLSLLGLIPFAYPILHKHQQLIIFWNDNLIYSYAAIVLSFIAGIHWGHALVKKSYQATFKLAYSSLVACLAWGFIIFSLDFKYFIGLFAFTMLVDIVLFWKIILKWFIALRVILTMIIIGLLAYTFIFLNPVVKPDMKETNKFNNIVKASASPAVIRMLIFD